MESQCYISDRMLYWFTDETSKEYITNDYGESVELSGNNYESQTFFVFGV